MKVIGLTGSIGSGKSTVAAVLEEKGAVIIDADRIARELMKPGTPVYDAVVKHFGNCILNEDKTINRKELGKIVFDHFDRLNLLNRLTHGPIIIEIKERIRRIESSSAGNQVIVIDAPLLIESGLNSLADIVVVVTVNKDEQKRRLEAKGLGNEEIDDRIGAQMEQEEALEYANLIIDNNGTLADLRKKIQDLWEKVTYKQDSIN